jgi:hypothetical protein
MVANETNKYAAFSQRKSDVNDSNWEETNPEEIETYIGILNIHGNCRTSRNR